MTTLELTLRISIIVEELRACADALDESRPHVAAALRRISRLLAGVCQRAAA